MTIKEIIQSTRISRLDCEVLLAGIIKQDKSFLVAHPEYELSEGESARWQSWQARAQSGEPIAYIRNKQEFYGYEFYVDERVLIPRPETEQIVDWAIEYVQTQIDARDLRVPLRLLEIGVGSGAICISITRKLIELGINPMKFRAYASDCAVEALAVAQKNAVDHGVSKAITWQVGDLFEPWRRQDDTSNIGFDLIIGNLPYLPTEEVLQNRFEPQIALDGGVDGKGVLRRFLKEAPGLLAESGKIIYEQYGGEVLVL